MHTWARKGIALAVSGVLTVGMAASLPFGSLADAADEDIIFQAEGEDLDGATTWTDIHGQQFPGKHQKMECMNSPLVLHRFWTKTDGNRPSPSMVQNL